MQFKASELPHFSDEITPITDRATALSALKLIVEQGEGFSPGEVPHNIHEGGDQDSHFVTFTKLHAAASTWKTVDYVDEPATSKYADNKVAYQVSRFSPCLPSREVHRL